MDINVWNVSFDGFVEQWILKFCVEIRHETNYNWLITAMNELLTEPFNSNTTPQRCRSNQ